MAPLRSEGRRPAGALPLWARPEWSRKFCRKNEKEKDINILSVQADGHQEQPFRVDPLLPEQISDS
ncbi:hypothetical protein U9M48_004670 [Paspalum notatum var. saurae]|uniref:Uncharacterized protein n=1 Tax=Paspalum notatum var. saurae TaxID=547442 RepID=A0AAQ3PKU9_PASNO